MNDLSKNDLSKNDLSNIIIKKDECKRIRKHNAIKLPDTLLHLSIPKYINYYKECYNIEQKLYREYFKIEKHPCQIKNKAYISSKSNKITIVEKLNQIIKILGDLDNVKNDVNNDVSNDVSNDVNTEDPKIVKLPKYISIKDHENDSSKFYLIYDNKNKTRHTLQLLCYKSSSFVQSLNTFLENIKNRFDKS
jgi:hypothetical protein